MAEPPRMARQMSAAIAVAMGWLRTVEPQLGRSADFAQVDVDTLLPIRGRIQKQLGYVCAQMFKAVALDPAVSRMVTSPVRMLRLRASVRLNHV